MAQLPEGMTAKVSGFFEDENRVELERSRANLFPDSEGVKHTGFKVTHWANIHCEHHPGGPFLVSWYWKEWRPLPPRWWHRLLRINRFGFEWTRYSMRVNEWHAPQLRDVVRIKECFGLMIETEGEPGAGYIKTREENAGS